MKRNNIKPNLDERVEDVHLYLEAKERLKDAETTGFIPMKQVMADLGITQSDLDSIEDVEIELSRLNPPHPSIILLEDYLKPKGISQRKFAQLINVPPYKIHSICNGKRGINAEMALKLAEALGTSAEVWMELQMDYDLDTARDRLSASDTKSYLEERGDRGDQQKYMKAMEKVANISPSLEEDNKE